ncbi:MAG: hypothetical protein RR744_07945 [Cellulosilyticaceae bacterium]
MEKNNKLTNAMALGMVLEMKEVQGNSELKEKIEKMLEQTNRKNANGKSTGTLSAEQKKNEEIKNKLLDVITTEPKSIKEMQLENETISPLVYSNQKLSALIRAMVGEGVVIRTEEKRVAKFSLAQ